MIDKENILEKLNDFLECEYKYLKVYYGVIEWDIYVKERKKYSAFYAPNVAPALRNRVNEEWIQRQKKNFENVNKRNVFAYGTFEVNNNMYYAFYLSGAEFSLQGMYYGVFFATILEHKLSIFSVYLWDYPENRDTSYPENKQWSYWMGEQFRTFPEIRNIEKICAPDYEVQLHYYNLM